MIKTIINSTIGLSTAFLLTIILHEIAHYAMSMFLGYETTLYHNKVFSKTQGVASHEILIAGIAPLFSLLQGIVAFQFSKKMRKSTLSLFMLWFGLAGIITFFGYLMIAPLIPIGDTGKVFSMLNIPLWVQVIISILAVILITIFLTKSTKAFEGYAIENFGSIKISRKKWSISLVLIPLICSILIITVFQFPVPHIASVLATVCAPFSIMAVFGTFIGSKREIARDLNSRGAINDKVSLTLVVLFVLTILVNRFLVNGI